MDKNFSFCGFKSVLIMALVALFSAELLAQDSPNERIVKFDKGEDRPVLAIGDSLMRILGKRFEKEFKKRGIMEASSFSSLGSGLARLDAFDWFAKIKSLKEEVNPKVIIALIGTNDRQTLMDEDGTSFEYGTAEWKNEYARRIGKCMDLMLEGDNVENVLWLLLPDMKDHIHQGYAQIVNEIIREQAAASDKHKEKIIIFDTRTVLSRKPGTYTDFIMSKTGKALTVRDTDGIHLSSEGANLLAERVITTFWRVK